MYISIRKRLKYQHLAIWDIIDQVDTSRLTKLPFPGKWSIKDNIAHLAKYQPVYMERLRLILTGENPEFQRYKAENDAEFETWRQYPLTQLLGQLEEDRKEIVSTIRSLSPADSNRTGIHLKYGALSLTEWTEFFLLHEAHHIYTIFQLAHDNEL